MTDRPTGHDKQPAFFLDVSDDIVGPVKAGMMLNIQRIRMRTLKRKLQCKVATMDVKAGSTPGPDFFQQCLTAVHASSERERAEATKYESGSDLDI